MFKSIKPIDVQFYLERLEHNIISNKPFNFEENRKYAENIYDFLDNYIGKRSAEIHPIKLGHLNNAKDILSEIISYCEEKNKDKVRYYFLELKEEFENYSSYGSIYLLRHPDKVVEEGKGRSLTFLGVKQAKHVAELIQEEILLSPKPVRVLIYTSEVSRTQIFGKIIEHINKAKKIGKQISISQKEDERLFLGNLSKEFYDFTYKIMKKYKTEETRFLKWLNKEEGYEEIIKKGGIADPEKAVANIGSFVKFAEEEASKSRDYYTIVIGISHSWILDSWLYNLTKIEKIISTAEYAKIEFGELYYKGIWKKIP